MADLSAFPITRKWPAADPTVLQLYSLPTPNGIKVGAMLEETGLPYEAHLVDFGSNDQMSPEFLSLNPNNKIPAILDPDGPGGPLALWESGAILVYLAEKTGKFLPSAPAARYETLQWLMFQMGGVGPMFGQFGHFFKFAADKVSDPYPETRYADESRRLLAVLDARLASRDFIMGEAYTIADMAAWPWVRTLGGFYEASERLSLDDFPHVGAWLARCLARPASQAALTIPAKP
ncbi:glutathione binding-like protein [Albimonas pacifica]|uniref:GST-like protein n=1 Tax=Albimonas pacifica TaxID=1114924 RepID=A0A1I3C1F6_9RHOB|nr:glutathione binding-like protein [Albimonas pacifica]SFH68322.1 GST-like protein [Albimonas pacifica]